MRHASANSPTSPALLAAAAAALLFTLTACAAFATKPREDRSILLAAVADSTTWGTVFPGLQPLRNRDATLTTHPWPAIPVHDVATQDAGRWIYAATYDGVLVSRDGGQTCWLSGLNELPPVLTVRSRPNDPGAVFAGTTDGLYFTHNILVEGTVWRPFKPTSFFRYCSDIQIDRRDPDTIWVGTEAGVFVAGPKDSVFRRVGPRTEVHQILQDPRDPDRLWAATHGEGLFQTRDHGMTWHRLETAPRICYAITVDRLNPGRILCTGRGVVVSLPDSGEVWDRASSTLPDDLSIYAIAQDPRDLRRTVLATSDGLFAARDDAPWERVGLAGTVVRGLRFIDPPATPPQPRTIREPAPAPSTKPATPRRRNVSGPQFAARQREISQQIVLAPPPDLGQPDFFFTAIARVKEGRRSKTFWRSVRAALAFPGSTLARELALRAFYLQCQRSLPTDLKAHIESLLPGRTLVRGLGEHRDISYYTTLLLTAQACAERPGTDWFHGLSSNECRRLSEAWLTDYLTSLGRRGQTDYDSPQHLQTFVATMLLLHGYAESTSIQALATDALELLLADYLTESLQGAWCGAHADVEPTDAFAAATHPVVGYHYLYAGGIPRPAKLSAWLAVAAYSWYQPPAILETIGNKRSSPYEVREAKRTRPLVRGEGPTSALALRYTYMTETYGMGSVRSSAPPPAHRRTFGLTWRGASGVATLLAVHPHVDAASLGRYQPGDPATLVARTAAAWPAYPTPDKWVSASPFVRLRQQKNTLLALYDFPEATPFQEVRLSLPSTLQTTRDGPWLFGQDGGFFVAIQSTAKGEILADPTRPEHRIYRCAGPRLGLLIVAGSGKVRAPGASGLETFAEFRERMLADGSLTLSTAGADPAVAHTFADGSTLRVTAEDELDGNPEKLFDSPFLTSWWQSGQVQLTDGDETHVLMFGSQK